MALDAARAIVSETGLEGLTTRKVAKRIGYTVGTLYQLFNDADDLIEQMNTRTLAGLLRRLQDGRFIEGSGIEPESAGGTIYPLRTLNAAALGSSL